MEAVLIHEDRQTWHEEAKTSFFDFSDGSRRTKESKKTNSVFYACMSVLINNNHIKVVDRVWEVYQATGETQDRNTMVCIVPL